MADLNSAIMQALQAQTYPNYGLRENGTPKAKGFFGELKRPDGDISTELSVEVDGQTIPLLVPTLDTSEVTHLLSGGSPTRAIIKKSVEHARSRISQGLSPFASNEEIPYGIKMPDDPHSVNWQLMQQEATKEAARAGIPAIAANPGEAAPYRARLQDAIARAIAGGVEVPHFIGTPTEPTGDRAGTMDIENLVNGLKIQELAAARSGDAQALDKISRERAYWEAQLAQGMSAQQWKEQTGEDDPRYGLQFFVGQPALR